MIIEGKSASLTNSAREGRRSQRYGSIQNKDARVGDSEHSREHQDHGGDYFDGEQNSIIQRLNRIKVEAAGDVLDKFDQEKDIDSKKRVSSQATQSYSFNSDEEKRDAFDDIVD